jgi:hypothetical protein
MNTTLAEELLLLALDPEQPTATTPAGTILAHGLAGGLVLELLLRQAVAVSGHGRLMVTDQPAADELLDDVLVRIRASRRPHDVTGWVRVLARRPTSLRRRLARRLLHAGVLREDVHRVLGMVPVRRYAVADAAALERLRARLRAALLGDSALDPRTASLIALAGACGLVDGLVDRSKRRDARRRAAAISDRALAGGAVAAAIRQAQADVIAGVTAAIVASTSPTSG